MLLPESSVEFEQYDLSILLSSSRFILIVFEYSALQSSEPLRQSEPLSTYKVIDPSLPLPKSAGTK